MKVLRDGSSPHPIKRYDAQNPRSATTVLTGQQAVPSLLGQFRQPALAVL